MTDDMTSGAVELATELTVAWLSNPNTRINAEEVPNFLRSMHDAVSSLSGGGQSVEAEEPQQQYEGAVTARKSLVSPDHILSMIDGKPYKSLKRHLSRHGLTPQQYRERYGLKKDYPMVSKTYSETRRAMAKKIGLGRKPRSEAAPAAKTGRGGRRKAASAEAAAE